MIDVTINGKTIEASEGRSLLSAALAAGIYIPHLCHHSQFGSSPEMLSAKTVYRNGRPQEGEAGSLFAGCNLCLVEIQGQDGPVQSCRTAVAAGMTVSTDSDAIKKARETSIAKILETHPHVCLVCAQSAGCDRKGCSLQIPENERCCAKFGICELQKVADFIGIQKGVPPYIPPVKIATAETEPLIKRDYDLCIGCLRCVRVCKETKGADALSFTAANGRVVVGSKEATLKASGCHFCGFCVEVCPTGALTDRDLRAGKREDSLVPCRNRCPAEIDVPRYIRFVAEGKYAEATGVIREKVPFPSVLGRVCFHPCETVCRRGTLDQPVAICALKRAAVDLGDQSSPQAPVRERTDRKVAVIGSGPAGLTAAYYLNSLGHAVTVFESLPEAGGMLRAGIPKFRLPRPELDREIKAITDAGVELRTNCRVESVDELLAEGFHAVFVAVGAHRGMKPGIPGENAEGVVDGVSFLRQVNAGEQDSIGERVAVIGGGNVALDSARNALRLGARSVIVYYRRSRSEMPAHEEEIVAALEEGVGIEYLTAPKGIEKTDKGLNLLLVRMDLGEPDESGRRRPIPRTGSEFAVEADAVITAIGQQSVLPEGVPRVPDSPSSARLAVEADAARGIFLGGDLVTGPKTVIDAIAGGRQGAILIDKFLCGEGNIGQVFADTQVSPLEEIRAGYVDAGRTQMPMLPIGERLRRFPEVHLGFDQGLAGLEATRCLGCDLRFRLKPSVMPPERYLTLTGENVQDLPETEGVYVLYNEQKEIHKISGTENLRQSLQQECDAGGAARYFTYEEDPMFTMKERQLVQQYMKGTGSMPPGNADLDDLF